MTKLSFLLLILCQHVWAHCPNVLTNKSHLFPLSALRPTQFSYGSLSLPSKMKKIEDAFNKTKLDDYLLSKKAPVVIGPGCKVWITDRHHTSLAILKANIPENKKGLYIEIIKDWSEKSKKEFASLMIKSKFVWLKDDQAQQRKFSELPESISKLKEDPFRSLAWKVAKVKGFKKIDLPFLEFYWAEFYKKNKLVLKSSKKDDINKVLEQAFALSRSKKAIHMPGFIKN